MPNADDEFSYVTCEDGRCLVMHRKGDGWEGMYYVYGVEEARAFRDLITTGDKRALGILHALRLGRPIMGGLG